MYSPPLFLKAQFTMQSLLSSPLRQLVSPNSLPPTPPPTQNKPERTNFSENQRMWIIYLTGLARAELGRDDHDCSREVYELVCSKLSVQHRRSPSHKRFRDIWNRFNEFGTVRKSPIKSGPKEKMREEVKYALLQGQSVRKVSAGFGNISKSSVARIAGESKLYWYRTPLGQKLTLDHYKLRREFARRLHKALNLKTIDIDNVCFTDESQFGCGYVSNRQNDGQWAEKGEFDRNDVQEVAKRGDTVMVFCLLHSKVGVIGPYFIDEIECPGEDKSTLNKERYVWLLKHEVIPELKRRLQDDFKTCWFQQDGAPAHTAQYSLNYLRSEFGNRIISLKSEFIWPPYSPDLSPLDYWFWSAMKTKVGGTDPQTAAEIKCAVQLVCTEFSANQVRRGISDLPLRLMAVLEMGGGHFQNDLQKFKNRVLKSAKMCDSCGEEHICQCTDCASICDARLLAHFGCAEDGSDNDSEISDLDTAILI